MHTSARQAWLWWKEEGVCLSVSGRIALDVRFKRHGTET